ncbi:EamA family transporter [Pilimelia terevasa]|nr:EamA family transporter [Pilimelia terevasa]
MDLQPTAASRGPAVAAVLGACVSLQVGAACAARLFPAGGTAGTTLLRLALAGLLLLAAARPAVRAWDRRPWGAVALLGLCLAGMNASFYAAIARIPLGPAVTIEFLGPLALAAVLSRRARDLLWVGLALAGVVLLGTAGHAPGAGGLDPVGVALVLVAGAFWAGYIVVTARVGAAVPGLGGLAVATGVAALALVPFGTPGAVAALARPELLPLVLGTAVLASVIPYSLEFVALRRLPTRTFGVLLSLEPAVAALAGWLLLGQPLGALGWVAVAAVVAASAGSTWSARSATAAPEPAGPVPDLPEPGLVLPEPDLVLPEPGLVLPELAPDLPEPAPVLPEPAAVVAAAAGRRDAPQTCAAT